MKMTKEVFEFKVREIVGNEIFDSWRDEIDIAFDKNKTPQETSDWIFDLIF